MGSAAKTLSRKTLFSGRVFRLEQDRVRLTNGRTVTMDLVRHRGSVVLIPQPSPGRVILIHQFRYAIGRTIWELPAGSLEAGEPPAVGARRECEEEIGWYPQHIQRLGLYYPTPGFCDERMVFYLCTGLVRPSRHVERDPDEQIVPRTFTVKEAWALADRGHIRDMKTLLGLVLAERAAKRNRSGRRRGRKRTGPVSA